MSRTNQQKGKQRGENGRRTRKERRTRRRTRRSGKNRRIIRILWLCERLSSSLSHINVSFCFICKVACLHPDKSVSVIRAAKERERKERLVAATAAHCQKNETSDDEDVSVISRWPNYQPVYQGYKSADKNRVGTIYYLLPSFFFLLFSDAVS